MGLSNIKEKKIFVELDKKRELRFDLNAMAELEEIYGDFQETIESLNKKISIKAMRALLYAGLKHEDESLTLKKVGSMVKMSDLAMLTQKITEAFTADMPDEKDLEEIPDENKTGALKGDAPEVKN